MKRSEIISNLERNKEVFKSVLQNRSREQVVWKPTPDKWCMLEVLCHLVDEEREDFRTRVRSVLEDPDQAPPSIDPQGWVSSRKYLDQDFDMKLNEFLEERALSIAWLKSLADPKWENAYQHPKLGPMSAGLFLANWLAHDYIHIRQLNRLAYEFHQDQSGIDLSYAGNW